MIGFDDINSKIIAGSVQKTNIQNINQPLSASQKEEVKNTEFASNQLTEKRHASAAMKGATILAGIVVAGIAITKAKGPVLRWFKKAATTANNSFTGAAESPVTSNLKPDVDIDVDFIDKELFKNERLKDIIREKFPKITDIAKDNFDRQMERLSKLVKKEDKPIPYTDKRLFTSHEAKMVASYQDEYAFNIPLRLGKISPKTSIEIRTMDAMMEAAQPLENDATVFRGIVTKDNGNVLDFAHELFAGNTLTDKAFVSTSRNAAETIAQFGEQSGYVMRIHLPKGTKGIDCRRFTTRELNTGANAEFILPRNSKFFINSVDDNYKIIDANYILQN